MSKISIIVPVYNVEKYLPECMDSIVNQTMKDIEIICVNDGSPDNSLSILEKYASIDERIKIITKENGGYASAVNRGLEVATSDFIQIVESDDFCALDMCEKLYNKIVNTNADFVVADFFSIRGEKYTRNRYLKNEDKNIEYFNLKTLPYIISNTAYPWKNLYRKDFLEKNKIRMLQDGIGAYEDQTWNATILSLASKILYLDEPLYYYRLDATGSSTNNGGRKMTNYIKRKAQTKEILIKNNAYNDDIKEYFANSAIGGSLFFFKRISFEYKEEYYNLMKAFLKETIDYTVSFKYCTKKNIKRFNDIMKKDYKTFYCLNIFQHNIKNFIKKLGVN